MCNMSLIFILQSFKPTEAIHTGLAVLLAVRFPYYSLLTAHSHDIGAYQVANGVSDSYNALVELLESIGHFLMRLDIYTKFPPTPATDEVVVKIMLELISTLALATKEVRQGRPSEHVSL